jgi:4-amino-4-deoxy-L-arabinose transferase-like glycosyltransferase
MLLALTLPHLDQGDFRGETAHYAAVGLQAWQNPALFWTPHEHPDVHYFNKPPLVFWLHGLVLHLWGISLAAARLPSILAAAGCVLCTVGLTQVLAGRTLALTTGCVMALTYEFFRRSREICLDMWQLLFILAAVWIWVATAPQRNQRLTWLAGIPLGLALMCKPLMALMVIPIMFLWLYLERRHHSTAGATGRSYGSILAITGIALLVALPWHASMMIQYGSEFTRQYFGHEVVARLQGLRNREPIWYYAIEIGRSYWPWLPALLVGLYRWKNAPISRRHRYTLALASIWILCWSIALTLFPDKRPRYELPLYPMMALVAAYGIATCFRRPLRNWYRHGLPTTAFLAVTLSLGIQLLPIRVQEPPDKNLTALVNWARQQDPARVYSAAMTANDESTLFLKAGYWPTPLRLASKPLQPGSLLLFKAPFETKFTVPTKPVFDQEPYHIIEAGF